MPPGSPSVCPWLEFAKKGSGLLSVKPETRQRRLAKFVLMLEARETLH